MRAIDNMTPQEIETLALKGMTTPRTAGERNTSQYAMTDAHGKPLSGLYTSEEIEAIGREKQGNKAQHSPKGLYIQDIEVANYCDKLKAHADKLAEALRECRMSLTLDYHGSTKPKKALCDVSAGASQAHNKAVLALAAYEAAQ